MGYALNCGPAMLRTLCTTPQLAVGCGGDPMVWFESGRVFDRNQPLCN